MLDSFSLSLLGKAVLAGVLGFIIGWERENSGSAAGDRTFALVSLSSAVLTAFAMAAFPENADRIIANLVTGVAFLGAGLILRKDTGEVRGLTTAAGLWATTMMGVLVGAGYLVASALLTGLVLVILLWEELPFVARLGLRNTRSQSTDERTRVREVAAPARAEDTLIPAARESRLGDSTSPSPCPQETDGQHGAQGKDCQQPEPE